jgi:outer membrane translocation and assembly module TamA
MLKNVMAVFILIFFLSFPLAAASSSSSTHILEIHGNTFFDKNTLLDVAGAKTKSFFQFCKEDTARIDDRLIPTLAPTLRSFYESEGFYHAQIEIKEDNTTVDVWIDAGKPVIVRDVNISSDYNISRIVTFHKGERFSAKKFVMIKAEIIKQLLEEGYCSYDLDTKAYIDLEKNLADLVYRLKKGGVCTFGETTIKGLKTIDPEIVMSRVRAKKGTRYSSKKIKETYTDVYGLESFDRVSVDFNRKFFNVVPIDISVEEISKPYHYEVGAGYDTFIGPRVHGKIIKKNFMSNAQKASLRLSWSKREQVAIADFFKPTLFWAWGYGIDFAAQGGYSNLEYIGFKEEKLFAKFDLEHEEGDVALKLGLAIEHIKISLLSSTVNLRQAINDGNFLLFYPYMSFIYDMRDDKLNPKEGYYLKSYFEYALPYKEDATVYTKSYLEGHLIHTIFDKLTLAGVLKAGVVDVASNELPESKLFFGGGSFSNRAYGYNTIGVILSPTVDTIYGAHTMLNLSLEADYPLYGNLYGALFTDNTMLTDKSYDFNGEVISSVGIGVRYMTPVGPFKLDVGFNVHKPSQYGISFQIGQSF